MRIIQEFTDKEYKDLVLEFYNYFEDGYKFEEFLKSNIGSTQEVLIEKRPDRKTGMLKGVTRNYINVLLEEGEYNTLQSVTLNKIVGSKMFS